MLHRRCALHRRDKGVMEKAMVWLAYFLALSSELLFCFLLENVFSRARWVHPSGTRRAVIRYRKRRANTYIYVGLSSNYVVYYVYMGNSKKKKNRNILQNEKIMYLSELIQKNFFSPCY